MRRPLFPDVVVNGETISAALVAAEAQNHTAPAGKPGLAWHKAARALVIRALLLQKARNAGITPDPVEVAPGKLETPEEALVRQVLDLNVEVRSPDEADVRAFYDANPDRLRAPSLYEPAHILIPVPKGPNEEKRKAAHDLCQQIIDKLQTNPKAFADLALEHSACPSRDNGGRLGQIATGDTVPEFEAAMDALDQGGMSRAPVQTRYGLHVIRLDAKSEGQVLPFDSVADGVRESLEKRNWTLAARDFVDQLVAEAEITGVNMTAERTAPPS